MTQIRLMEHHLKFIYICRTVVPNSSEERTMKLVSEKLYGKQHYDRYKNFMNSLDPQEDSVLVLAERTDNRVNIDDLCHITECGFIDYCSKRGPWDYWGFFKKAPIITLAVLINRGIITPAQEYFRQTPKEQLILEERKIIPGQTVKVEDILAAYAECYRKI